MLVKGSPLENLVDLIFDFGFGEDNYDLKRRESRAETCRMCRC